MFDSTTSLMATITVIGAVPAAALTLIVAAWIEDRVVRSGRGAHRA